MDDLLRKASIGCGSLLISLGVVILLLLLVRLAGISFSTSRGPFLIFQLTDNNWSILLFAILTILIGVVVFVGGLLISAKIAEYFKDK